MTNQRDTQFRDFAKLLWSEIKDHFGDWWEADNTNVNNEAQEVIARRAYDLASHIVSSCVDQEEECRHRCYREELLRDIPDMTELPDQKGM